jgi:hypothetical protein
MAPTAPWVTEAQVSRNYFCITQIIIIFFCPHAPLHCTPWNPSQQSGPRTPATTRLGSPKSAADSVDSSWQNQQAGPRPPAACRFGFPMPAPAAVSPWSPCPKTCRPQGLHCLVGARWLKPATLLPPRSPQLATQCQEFATTHLSEPKTPGFAILLVPRGFPPHRAWRPSIPTASDIKRDFAPPSKSENARFPTDGRKVITCYSAGGTRSPVSPKYTKAQRFTLHLPPGDPWLSCPRTGTPGPPMSGNPLCWC